MVTIYTVSGTEMYCKRQAGQALRIPTACNNTSIATEPRNENTNPQREARAVGVPHSRNNDLYSTTTTATLSPTPGYGSRLAVPALAELSGHESQKRVLLADACDGSLHAGEPSFFLRVGSLEAPLHLTRKLILEANK